MQPSVAAVPQPGVERDLERVRALRAQRQLTQALALLEELARRYPNSGLLYQERGDCYRALGDRDAAIAGYQRAVELNDALPASWQALAELCAAAGRSAQAANARRCLARLSSLPPELATASRVLSEGELKLAEQLVRSYLVRHGSHIEGMRLLAQIGIKLDVLDDAELLLENILALAPDYHEARYEYAAVLVQRRLYEPALQQARTLLGIEPDNPLYLKLYAQSCDGLGRYDEALRVYRQLLQQNPDNVELELLIGYVQRMRGDSQEAIRRYRNAAAKPAGLGLASLALANMKTYRFGDQDIERMRAAEADAATTPADRIPLCFALGKALEDREQFADSYRYYERGNRLKRAELPYRPDLMERNLRLHASVCTREFFAARAGSGSRRADPIFIVGLPRSGSTLIEQILASHSQVEGTMELPDMPRIAHQFRNRDGNESAPRYPAVLAELDAAELRRLADIYLEGTRVHRHSAPFFIDKMPSNFREIGLIQLILPNARIIDARREPMACCFGNFKQLFTNGHEFSYSLEDVARYYRNYVELMQHWDQVLPGRILRVQHESLVEDLEGNVRRMLDYCGLAFEPACLEFYRTVRNVRTVSSEQVRRPIFRDGLQQWRNFEPWLGPLKAALGLASVSAPA